MKFLCFYCQPEWSSAKRKDSVNLLTHIKSSMLFIEMKKVCFALFHLELWDTPAQQDLLLCSISLSISPYVFLLLGWKAFPSNICERKGKIHCFATVFSFVGWTLLVFYFFSIPSTLNTKNHDPKDHSWDKIDGEKTDLRKEMRSWLTRRQILFTFGHIFSFFTIADL